MAEERFTSQYDGTTQDNLLKFSENVKKATTVDGAETVNVQGFTLPRISDISGFVAVNNAGNAIGFMSKEQIASVLGELLPVVSSSTKGFVDKKWSGVASPCSLYGGGQETLIGRYTGQDAYCTLLVCVSFYNLSNTSLFLISFTENSCQAKKIAGIDYTFRFSNKNLYVQASDTMITAYILTDSAGFVFAS